ncbi:hypothetical protein PX52LOC_04654 [Limnoglobus roseus]|uniref:Uncharacterized protein n=1 Tax=Limnoglobus roseus TaxID=2598579 RepID=A0A5C1AI30_9BACT|nr:hypothetical protein PX52LOC_04654 [Limnoglobus roseus]
MRCAGLPRGDRDRSGRAGRDHAFSHPKLLPLPNSIERAGVGWDRNARGLPPPGIRLTAPTDLDRRNNL